MGSLPDTLWHRWCMAVSSLHVTEHFAEISPYRHVAGCKLRITQAIIAAVILPKGRRQVGAAAWCLCFHGFPSSSHQTFINILPKLRQIAIKGASCTGFSPATEGCMIQIFGKPSNVHTIFLTIQFGADMKHRSESVSLWNGRLACEESLSMRKP